MYRTKSLFILTIYMLIFMNCSLRIMLLENPPWFLLLHFRKKIRSNMDPVVCSWKFFKD